MEEFKNLEAIIDLCTKELYTGDRNIHATLGFEELKELQGLLNKRRVLERGTGILINKTREQKRTIQGNHILLAKYFKKIEEQEKIIELMAKDIAENKLDEDICRQVKDPKKEECYAFQYDENACSDCVIEYYEKKARGNNANNNSR